MGVPPRSEIDDELRAEIEPLIPVRERRFRPPGRKPLPDRPALNGILHVLHNWIPYRDEMAPASIPPMEQATARI